ncbi:MAG TPA: helix-turn-helix transcriptional regulator [Pirellulales bacterium]
MGREILETSIARVFTQRAPSQVERVREYNTVRGNTARASFGDFNLSAPAGPSQNGGSMAKKRLNAQELGRRIKAAREFRGWEPGCLATFIGVRRRAIARYEAGNITDRELEIVAAALKLPVSHFLGACVLCRILSDELVEHS